MQLPPFPSVSPAVSWQRGRCGAAKRCERWLFFSLCQLEMFAMDLTATLQSTVGLKPKPTCSKLTAHLYMSSLTVVHSRTNSLLSKVQSHCAEMGDDSWEQFGVASFPAASLHSVAVCCPSVYAAHCIRSECLYACVCLFALEFRGLSHTVISPASGCWPSFCGPAAGPGPISPSASSYFTPICFLICF